MMDFDDCRNEIYTYPGLSDDWDGYGSSAPPAQAAHDAVNFLRYLEGLCCLPAPTPAPESKQVLLYWRTPEFHIEFGFEGDGRFYFYGRGPIRQQRLKHDDLEIVAGLPADIRSFLVANAERLTSSYD
jgi:hypothetical protein